MRNYFGLRGIRQGRGGAATVGTYSKPPIAALDYSSTVDTTRINLTAKFPIAIRNWSTTATYASGGTAYTFANSVKAANPSIKLLYYVILSQIDVTSGSSNTLYSQFATTINNGGGSRSWWTTTAGSTTQQTNYDTSYANTYEVNQTDYTQADGSLRHWPQAAASIYASTFQSMYSAGLFDGIMNDNTWFAPRADKMTLNNTACGDINLDGTNEAVDAESQARATNTTICSKYRAGYANFWASFKSALPGMKISANTDCCLVTGRTDISQYQASVSTTELTGKCDYPLIEAFVGKTYSTESNSGFSAGMTYYASAIGAMSTGGSVLNLCYLGDSVGNFPSLYRLGRYGLCATMLKDGGRMMPVDSPSGGAKCPVWLNEFDQLIGDAVDASQTAARSTGVWAGKGLWARAFQNGMVVVNPSDNRGRYMGSATVGGTLNLSRSSNVVTLSWAGLSGHGAVAGDLIKIEGCTTDSTFNGIFQITSVSPTSISWSQTSADASHATPIGYYALQTTVDLTGMGYKRFTTNNDSHNNYNGTLGSGTPVYTSQNDGTNVTTLTLWAQDAVLLLKQ